MVPREELTELRKIYLLERLSDKMLEKVISMVRPIQFNEKDVVFEAGDKAEYFYMLKSGKILLEVEVSKDITISLGSIKSGYSFGWSSLFSGASHTTHATCSEACEVLAIPGSKLRNLLEENHEMGYRIMDFTAMVLKNRLERRTEQFLRVMAKHPDIQKFLAVTGGEEERIPA